MGKKRERITADRLLTTLHQDPKWVEQQRARELEAAARHAASVVEQKELLRDLARVGCSVETIWDVVNSRAAYRPAVPVLLEHVTRHYSTGVTEGIVRALTTEFAAGQDTCEVLISEYKKLNDNSPNSLKWVLGNAISIVAVTECASHVIDLLRDKANGRARDMMTLRLGRICSSQLAGRVLAELLEDPEMEPFAARALKEL
jgi:hypothetical protein